MTEMVLNTKTKPKIGIKKGCPTTQALAPINPPKQSEPASPMNMLALFVLNIKNAKIEPENIMLKVFIFEMISIIEPVSPPVYN